MCILAISQNHLQQLNTALIKYIALSPPFIGHFSGSLHLFRIQNNTLKLSRSCPLENFKHDGHHLNQHLKISVKILKLHVKPLRQLCWQAALYSNSYCPEALPLSPKTLTKLCVHTRSIFLLFINSSIMKTHL